MTCFLESSAEELYKSAVKAFPKTTMRQYATHPIVIRELRWIPFVGVKTLFLKSLAQNEEREYGPCILFKGVNYGGKQVKIIASDGLQYNFDKLSLENTDILLRCNCPDFYWRFNYYNHLDKSLYGSKRRKYESEGGLPANPLQLPGMCKHLMKMTEVVANAGIFLE
jgi:hypothetical protein